ncbi:sigma-70 family RNA polymerase sigma factor [Micromonospora sp. NPDC049004]|uniref:RNA polymerase sigma factor n=1 Tax=Micromonospora sp. NPDC049004 TaxID=3154348 RepID=UPI0033D304C1
MSDGDLISEVYAGCYRRLVVQLYAVTGDLNEAQEAVQEAFTRALVSPGRFAGLENPEAWLRRVAVNWARSRYRRRRVLDGLLRRIGPPPAVADHSPEHLALLAALRVLPEGQRHALALHYLVDLPVDEVAATLGVSAGTVKSRLSRGRHALAALLADTESDGTATTNATNAGADATQVGRIDVRS